ncbi:MAG: hypothetical protein Q9N26_03525 [Aquificota bacterium]|nr:hypothetical protein [Aquificota bacterium]
MGKWVLFLVSLTGFSLAQGELIYKGVVKNIYRNSIEVHIADSPEGYSCSGVVEIMVSDPAVFRPGDGVELTLTDNPCGYEFMKAIKVRRISPEGLEVKEDDV